ncbi:MAG: hypothetical protein D6696_19315 [Acidobacteria bacterium]|nr:MAG: hypothetical protein D6696_19315 [Acidobacteriota bacterium]
MTSRSVAHPPSSPAARVLAAAAAALLGAGALVAATTGDDARADFERLRANRTGAPVALPPGGVTLKRDTATWIFDAGEVRFLEPTGDGVVSGLVFEGRGRFRMSVPDPVERAQLARFAEQPDLAGFDEPFTRAVLRTTEAQVMALFPTPAPGAASEDKLLAERQKNWLEQRFYDADARVICGTGMPGDAYLRIGVDSDGFGWLTYTYDGLQAEEISVARYDPKQDFTEVWLSLDRPEDRTADGRPTSRQRPAIDVTNVDVEVDLRDASRASGRVGLFDIQPRRGRFKAVLTFVPLVDGLHALPLELSSIAEVEAVSDAEGRPLTFFREHIGGRVSMVDKSVYDSSLVVWLEQPLAAGAPYRLTFDYERDVLNYMPGRSWYPGWPEEALHDLHTGTISIVARKKHDLRSMGTLVDQREEGDDKRLTWRIGTPVKMMTFSFAERFTEQSIAQDGLPEVIGFVASNAGAAKNKTYNVVTDLVNSINYFQQLFDDRLDGDHVYATSIIGGHGQSFDGFIHLAEITFDIEPGGFSELFRAHEAAHQWWGHRVGWASYRDQWLSEAFAEYSALMFLQVAREDGRKLYDQYVEAAIEEVSGVGRTRSFSRTGPISLGYRAATADSRDGYVVQSYRKGALVLHMLRNVLRNLTKSDDAFIQVMRRFVAEHRGGEASTQDFVDTLTEVVPAEWDWFFDQWVHNTEIPTYAWRYDVAARPDAGGRFALTLEIEQRDVPEGFRMPVPVEVDFGKGQVGQVVVMVDKPRETFTLPLPKKPKKVTLNPAGAVLARMAKL